MFSERRPSVHPPRATAALTLSALGSFLCSLDSALNVAFPAISADLGITPRQIALVIVLYHVPIGVLTVAGGMLGDRFGHRRVFACGVWTSALAFPLCALAGDYGALLAARAVQGAGAGMVFGTAPALVTLGLAPARRGLGLGILNLVAGAGLATAPLVAGVLVDAFGWRAVFLFRVPLAVVVGLVALVPLPAVRVTERPSGAGGVPSPTLPLVLGNVLAVVAHAASFAIYVLVPYFLIDVARYPASIAGVIFMTVPLSTSLGGLAGGWLTQRVAPRRLVVTGLALETSGLLAIATLRHDSSAPAMAAAFALTGLGLGLFQVPNMTLVMGALPDRNQGLAGGMISAMRTIGVLTAALLSPRLFGARQAARSPSIADEAALFTAAFSDTFLACTALSVVGLVVAVIAGARTRRGRSSAGSP